MACKFPENIPITSYRKGCKCDRCRIGAVAAQRKYIDANPKQREKNALAVRNHYNSRRAWLDSIKISSGCIDCGYNGYPEVLDFDHVRGTKEFSIGSLVHSRTKEDTLREITKCDIVCANCHRLRTVKRREEQNACTIRYYGAERTS